MTILEILRILNLLCTKKRTFITCYHTVNKNYNKKTKKRVRPGNVTFTMGGSRTFFKGGPGLPARKHSGQHFVFFSLNLSHSLQRGSNDIITEKTILFQGPRGGPTFSRGGGGGGGPAFSGGGGVGRVPNANFNRNPFNL